ncbi:probable rhamnogalacturonan acetylesterase YesY [Aspergillus lentulus]|uniref:Probable rhamnogalacturonan acetylesterase YesY n=1 Tax=Aspergillus lentulus TaxID=293939 RepID=A0ABQ1AC05_ASPLE|nr:probable rhamnogalacturonan acetylesterase YesY [Aspergillus lentulus]GFF29155.1 probable rhamnogalacturonan acetylesterase YesY [Aspergillus lentulus]GFF69975.1 probable rhamnogalacturonan acetylesterase YesY [Aspergillus lentulus]GFF70677.1 probable rhamnogalacturonan acetylesterase YesY [Aspergillus lentulus]GFF78518.1 probable rhamnogalacturonan acetylesterase YesY [Aspergillus lentulus]GFG06965.1 probable rhamnogalacturonan acetylesterase YesY [Aspergillus lentulus]
MRLPLLSFFILPLCALPTPGHSPKPPFFLLAGDSTTAKQSSNGGGWGDGFLNTALFHGASGLNYGHNGATTVSFRAGGDWATVLAKVAEYKDRYSPFVTIQFGHNDQKPAANISLAEYTRNLERFICEARDAGATPILVTPLSRRNYETSNITGEPTIILSLADQRAATIAAAKNSHAAYIDLNGASTLYLNRIGPEKAYTYNLNPEDRTHLNAEGSIVFGGMVAELIEGVFAGLKKAGYVRVDPRLKRALDRGAYYWPDTVDER